MNNSKFNVYRGVRGQRGHGGIGNFFASLFRSAMPLMKKSAKYLSREALNTSVRTAHDVMEGKNLKASLKKNLRKSGEDILDKTYTYVKKKMSGKGIKRSRSSNTINQEKLIKCIRGVESANTGKKSRRMISTKKPRLPATKNSEAALTPNKKIGTPKFKGSKYKEKISEQNNEEICDILQKKP